MKDLDVPFFYWHLELSNKCALKCSRCPRTEAPDLYSVTEMDLAFVQRILPPERLQSVERILLCGGEGDPIYCSDFLPIIEYLKSAKPTLCLAIVTNGSYRPPEFWQRLASLLNGYDTITFSIDGWDQESNRQYRANSDWKSMMPAVSILGQSPAQVFWSTILFKFNQERIEDIRLLARQQGADRFTLVRSSLFGSQVARYQDPVTGLDPLEPSAEFISHYGRHFKESLILSEKPYLTNAYGEMYRHWQNRMKARTADWNILPLCSFGNRALYVSAEKYLYPCSWVSHPYHGEKFSKLRPAASTTWAQSWFIDHREDFSLKTQEVDEVLSHPRWQELITSWQKADTTPITCEQKCLRRNVVASSLDRD